jgi:S-adenosylmethionine:tRNA ribosyltransferase-isomerase
VNLRTADYDYPLPGELIARHPLPHREESRMMVLHREGERIEHLRFSDFPGYVQPGDLVVLNDTRVIPARVFSDDGRIELLCLEALGERTWKCLVKPGRKMRVGASVTVGGITGTVQEILPPDGERVIEFASPLDLERSGTIPLPPYLEREAEPEDWHRYQTVYARHQGAVAAPTAGLHFTPEILRALPHAFVTLHVGIGTFRSVHAEDLTGHHMHRERYDLPAATVGAVAAARRVIAIGTTTVRVLETCAREHRPLRACSGSTEIFIHPPFDFRVTGALLTNFHLPKSTLLMLISAFANREFILRAYEEAIRERYRFFSYGDCMLIL